MKKLIKAVIPDKSSGFLKMSLENVIKNYTKWQDAVFKYPVMDCYCYPHKTAFAYYKTALDITKNLEYSKNDVEEFCKLINGDSKNITALYISVLVNNVVQDNETLVLEPNLPLNCFGYRLQRGRLIIEGSVGDLTCFEMVNGELIVEGNAGYFTGSRMVGGKLKVKGRIGSFASDIRSGEVWEKDRLAFTDQTFSKNILRKLGFKV